MPRRVFFFLLLAPLFSCRAPSNPVETTLQLIRTDYYRDADISRLREIGKKDGLAAMLDSLGDPDSLWIPAPHMRSMRHVSMGWVGIGVNIKTIRGWPRVVSVFPGSPADKAGFRPGDVLVRVDSRPTQGLSAQEAAEILRGRPGSRVSVSVARPPKSLSQNLSPSRTLIPPSPVTLTRPSDALSLKGEGGMRVAGEVERWPVAIFTLSREEIWIPSVAGSLLAGKLGYLRIYKFMEHTPEEALSSVKAMQEKGTRALVLDLRGNGGGLLNGCLQVATLFVGGRKLLASAEARNPKYEVRYQAGEKARFKHWKMAVLVDRTTAGGSEILAGILRDYGLAVLAGGSTAGKGTIKNIYPLPDGSAVSLTVSRVLLPSGRPVGPEGLPPDIRVEMTPSGAERAREYFKTHPGAVVFPDDPVVKAAIKALLPAS